MTSTYLGINKTCQSCSYARSDMMHDSCSWDIRNEDGPITVFQRVKDADGNYTALFCDKWRPQVWHLEQRIKELEKELADYLRWHGEDKVEIAALKELMLEAAVYLDRPHEGLGFRITIVQVADKLREAAK